MVSLGEDVVSLWEDVLSLGEEVLVWACWVWACWVCAWLGILLGSLQSCRLLYSSVVGG